MSLHCQCNQVAFDHSAGCCPKVGTIHAERAGVELWLCVDCILSSDVKLDPEDDDEEDDVDWELERSIERSEMEAECARLNRLR